MSEHITDWLNAYLDDELHGNRLQQVEEHLAACESCQAEFETLQGLSRLLHEGPAPQFTSAERLATRVNLLLPQRRAAASGRQILEAGWWMIPVGLLATWVFIGTAFFMSDMLSAANNLGLLNNVSNWMVFGPTSAYWSSTLGRFGVLSGNSLSWTESIESLTRTSLPQISLQISIALLYLSWIAIWWARRMRHERQPQGQLLEG
jgi:predicted anti-sigma-YlaC factor YlaD